MPHASGLPAWIEKRDGCRVPFEPDRISQALFAATEAQGTPDTFLARELADGVLHFAAQEFSPSEIPTTAQLAELVIKVVRELGQPALAEAFARERRRRAEVLPARTAEGTASETRPQKKDVVFRFAATASPQAVVRGALRAYSLHAVFSRDLAAAQDEGWLTLGGLESPLTVPGAVVSPVFVRERAIGESLDRFFVIDGPEYAGSQTDWHRLQEATGLTAVVNLNGAAPPPWAVERIAGPLFAEPRGRAPAGDTALDEALEQWLAADPARVRIAWHIGELDFERGAARLRRLARLATDTGNIDFVFDRPRRSILLAEGIDRQHPAVLLYVGLRLPRLLELPGVGADSRQLLLKLPSLGRMAISAAVQKRAYLRNHAGERLTRGFLLDRARLVVVPIGLEAVVRSLTGHALCTHAGALELGQQILSTLSANLRADGQAASLDVCVDGALGSAAPHFGFSLEEQADRPDAAHVAGVTPWDATAAPKTQLRCAGLLHAAAGLGTSAVLLPEGIAGEAIVDLLHFAWKQTDVIRLRLLRPPTEQRQLAL